MDRQTEQRRAGRAVRVRVVGELLDWVVAVPAVLVLSVWAATVAGQIWVAVAAYFGLTIGGTALQLVIDLWQIRRGTSPLLDLAVDRPTATRAEPSPQAEDRPGVTS